VLLREDRATAYQFWVLHMPGSGAYGAFSATNPIIVKGGYLLRSASTSGGTLALKGDLNGTTSFEIIAPATSAKKVTFNGDNLALTKTKYGTLTATKDARLPTVTLPHLTAGSTWVRFRIMNQMAPLILLGSENGEQPSRNLCRLL
jgi:opacity protein-like surface antigen